MADRMGYGRNGYTREEWLYSILHSGEVTRIGQHLALVIYHLADLDTHTAQLSLRDLEKITGWTRQAIRDHIEEIDIFVRVKWGMGRAKSYFEMQGIIAEEMDKIKAATQLATTVATTPAVTVVSSVAVNHEATTATSNGSVQPNGHNVHATNGFVANHVATNLNEGGTIGGESNNNLLSNSLSQVVARDGDVNATAPTFTIEADGSFAGQVFEIPAVEMVALKAAYQFLTWPSELVAADKFLSSQFLDEAGRTGKKLDLHQRMARLHQYLAAMNAKRDAMICQTISASQSKAARIGDEDCCWNEDRLSVGGAFKAELLDQVGGNTKKLENVLTKAAGKIPLDLKGPNLRKLVRSEFVKHLDWDERDERKTVAIEKRVVGKQQPALGGDDALRSIRAITGAA